MHPSYEEKSKLDTLIQQQLTFDLQYHDMFVRDLDLVESYLNSVQTPAGFTDYGRDAVASINDPNTIAKHRYYVVINQVVQAHERILGNFSKARQTVTLAGRGLKDYRKASVLERGSKYVEDCNRTFSTVVFPAIDNMLSGGLGGARQHYDAYDRPPNGWIREEFIDPANLIVDAGSIHPFYNDTQRRWVRMTFERSEAIAQFTGIDGFDPTLLKSDVEYAKALTARGLKTDAEYVTVYFMEYCKRETYYRKISGSEIGDIPKEEYDQARSEGRKDVIPDKAWVWYQVYHNPGYGVFWHAVSDIDYWTIHLLAGRRTRNKPYPISDFIAYKNLQDLFNTLVTAALDDAREGRKWAVAMDPAHFATYGEQVAKQLAEGFAVIPSNVANAITHPGLSQGVLWLLEFVKRSIDDINSMPSVTKGELPAKQISSETVNVLQAAAAISHGRKDIMINEFITSMAKTRMKMMVKYWDEEDWFRVIDAAPGAPEYVPMNMTIEGEDAYLELLAKMYQIPVPPSGQPIPPEIAQAFQQAKQHFEEGNSVEVEEQDRHGYDGQRFTDQEHETNIQASGMTPTDFVNAKSVEMKSTKIFKINIIDPSIDLDVKCTVDFDIDQSKQRKQSLSFELGNRGWLHPIDVMKALEVEDPERKFDRAQRENQLRQMAEKLASDKNFQQAVEVGQQIVSDPKLLEVFKSVVQQISQGAPNAAQNPGS